MKKFFKKMSTVVFTGVIATLLLVGCGKGAKDNRVVIDLDNCVEYEITGYDGYGIANAKFSTGKFENELLKIGLDADNPRDWDQIDKIESKIRGSWDKSKEISNGDVVRYTWDFDVDMLAEKYKAVIHYTQYEHEVTELTPIREVSAFDGVEFVFDGKNGTGSIRANKTNATFKYGIEFTFSQKDGLSNGDEVIVTAEITDAESIENMKSSAGITLGETETTCVVTGLGDYVSSISQIPAEMLEEMKAMSRDYFVENEVSEWNNPDWFLDMQYIGNYVMCTNKESDYCPNMCYMVFKITATNDLATEPFEYYYYCRFRKLVAYENEVVFEAEALDRFDAPDYMVFLGLSGDAFRHDGYVYGGFETFDDFYNEKILPNLDEYSFEDNMENDANAVEQSDIEPEE